MKAKVLILDIETAPLQTFTWGIHDQNISVNQIKSDWHLLSYAAKWLGEKTMFYRDQRKAKDMTDDRRLVQDLWDLMNEADIVCGQNSTDFDVKKIKARMIFHGMRPPRPFQQIDTKKLAKKHFGFTSNSLEHLSDILTSVKKSAHTKFPGMSLWTECLKGNLSAWKEMELYNKRDVISTEALYNRFRIWDTAVSPHLEESGCRNCGGWKLIGRGYSRTVAGKYRRLQCKDCGAWQKSSVNLLTPAERKERPRAG